MGIRERLLTFTETYDLEDIMVLFFSFKNNVTKYYHPHFIAENSEGRDD